MARRDHGQAVVLVLAVIVIAALAALGAAELGTQVIHRSRARAAADAAALAGVSGGRALAARFAAANGATLISYSSDGHQVTVVVQVVDERAAASASDQP
jgi:hypothetical protein